MQVEELVQKTYKLTLTEQEAQVLKGYVQNNMFPDGEDEPDSIHNLRSLIFHGLLDAGLE